MARAKGTPKTGGRQKGTPNKRTREAATACAESGLTPVEYLVSVYRDPSVELDRRIDAAKAVAPYLHARLSTTTLKGDAESGTEIIVQINRFTTPDGLLSAGGE